MSATVSLITIAVSCMFVVFVETRKFRPGVLSDYNDYGSNDENSNYDYFFKVLIFNLFNSDCHLREYLQIYVRKIRKIVIVRKRRCTITLMLLHM